jgi:uncharacterized phage protein gp47/JayE
VTTYPLLSLSAAVSDTGIYAPTYSDILQSLIAKYQSIFGSDAYLAADSQDGQLLGIVALAINSANQMAISVYNQFAPSTAQGTGLSSVVKVNGITRQIATNSSVVLTVVGQAGTVITNGAITDNANLGTVWLLPLSVTIPPGGSIAVTATCSVPGATAASPGSLTQIRTPTAGWQTVTNPASATLGQPLESDAALRRRQAASTAIPSQSVLAGMIGALEALPGVVQVAAAENTTGTTDANGVPGHSVSFTVQGGNTQSIVNTIGSKKTIGTGTYGTTTGNYVDVFGIARAVGYFVPTQNTISVSISLKALSGYTTVIGSEIKAAVSAYINSLGIGGDVYISKLYVPANLSGPFAVPTSNLDATTFDITSILAAISPASPSAADVVIAFNAVAVCTPANITINVF